MRRSSHASPFGARRISNEVKDYSRLHSRQLFYTQKGKVCQTHMQISKGRPDLTLKVTGTITEGDYKEHEWACKGMHRQG